MEVRIKEKTLAGSFLRYMALFCVNTIAIFLVVYVALLISIRAEVIFPANYAETFLQKNTEHIRTVNLVQKEDVPPGCEYGVFTKDGNWLYGNFPKEEYAEVWKAYEKQDIFAGVEYLRFIERKNGEICIVKYKLEVRYNAEILNQILPRVELLLPIIIVVLFLLQTVILSRLFSRNLKKRLKQLNDTTQKISENDLEFQVGKSDFKEINEVLISMGQMKDALQKSLKKQWDMEEEQNRQLRAISHDIKTPLTIIRGNVELLTEDVDTSNVDTEFFKSSLGSIGENVEEMEQYLERMRMILQHGKTTEKQICIACEKFQEELRSQAAQLISVKHIPLMMQGCDSKGTILVNREQMRRAFGNVLSNAVEYTDAELGIDILISEEKRDESWYLIVKVSDYGKGFSEEELQFATEEFYRGDESRHDRSHQGLGLAIAKRFLKEQGGFLEIRNSPKTGGGEVTLGFLLYPKSQVVSES